MELPLYLRAGRPWRTAAQQGATPQVLGTSELIDVFHQGPTSSEQSRQWLRCKSLALLMVPRKSDGDDGDKYGSELNIEEESLDHGKSVDENVHHVQSKAGADSSDPISTCFKQPDEKSACQKRKCHWPGCAVKRQGHWPGFEIVNCGGMEWIESSIGSEILTYHHGKLYKCLG